MGHAWLPNSAKGLPQIEQIFIVVPFLGLRPYRRGAGRAGAFKNRQTTINRQSGDRGEYDEDEDLCDGPHPRAEKLR
jgi:hypothetical protein